MLPATPLRIPSAALAALLCAGAFAATLSVGRPNPQPAEGTVIGMIDGTVGSTAGGTVGGTVGAKIAAPPASPDTGSVIFIHPDGASAATWTAARALHVGPDGDLNWDLLPAIAVYRGHMGDSLTATSNGGGTTHAFGVKVRSDAYGRTGGGATGEPILTAAGASAGVARQAIAAGIPVGLVQTGIAPEPGSACFIADAASRYEYDAIAAQLIERGATVLFSGGEKHFLPRGVAGVHGPGAREDDRNLIDEARTAGFTIVRTRAELLALPADTERVLGLFAHDATFNAAPEEALRAAGRPLYVPGTPSVAEMTEVALRILAAKSERFMLVVEEEATDNFGNQNNAAGVLEAARRADAAIGVAQRFLLESPQTLVMTTADSDAGGLRMQGIIHRDGGALAAVPERDFNGAPLDGVGGTGTMPFRAAPDRFGRSLAFRVHWAGRDDLSGGILVRAGGFNAHRVRGTMDNTDVAELMRRTLFGSAMVPAQP
ncbi:MAG: alkaline phosphatase [Phycisphaerales bacterium]